MLTDRQPLQRILGAPTAWLVGMGVAIGSGIFRTPGDVAGALHWPLLILAVWVLGGVIVAIQGMVTAELATRFPEAGGEYAFLREAYGEFVAFFFGWAYTVFIIGGGAAAISLAFGDFSVELLRIENPIVVAVPRTGIRLFDAAITPDITWSGVIAAAVIAAVTAVNAIGLRAGAWVQNLLTAVKILALISVVVIGFALGGGVATPAPDSATSGHNLTASLFVAGLLPVLWSYNGTTDAVKLAEEIRDVRRALPLAIIGSTVALIALYTAFNGALLYVMPASEMKGLASVPGEAMAQLFGPHGRTAMLLAAMLVSLGSLSSTVLATIRVTFALARDGLTFRFMSRMSHSQSPVAALFVVGGFAVMLVLNRNFTKVLDIYFFASAVLFGLSYASLLIFRARDPSPAGIFHCPFGRGLAVLLILIQLGLAVNIAVDNPGDVAYTGGLLLFFAGLYFVWKRFAR